MTDYWTLFTESGRIEDYLQYKQSATDIANGEEPCCEDNDGRACDMGDEDG